MSDYFDLVERQLVRSVEAGSPRSRRSPVRFEHLGYAAAALVVCAVLAFSLVVRGARTGGSAANRGRPGIAFNVVPLGGAAQSPASIAQSVAIFGDRVHAAVRGARIAASGDRVVVTVTRKSDLAQIVALAAPGYLAFYDWEANALMPTGADAGKTVASRLQIQDPAALSISQGSASAAPGSPGTGSVGLYQAVQLAHQQPVASPNRHESHLGPTFYLFGAPGSAACTLAAQARHAPAIHAEHCLLAGPDDSVNDVRAQLRRAFGDRMTLAAGRLLTVPRGTVVLQAEDPDPSRPVAASSPLAQFFILEDNYAFQGQITNPVAGTDTGGNSDVQFGFTSAGQQQFARVTKQVAMRGFLSPPGHTLNQHFAIAVDGKLISVPSIDYHLYPDGISGGHGADIAGGFTSTTARDLAALLRFGPLSVKLELP
jgi:hypothetical protein